MNSNNFMKTMQMKFMRKVMSKAMLIASFNDGKVKIIDKIITIFRKFNLARVFKPEELTKNNKHNGKIDAIKNAMRFLDKVTASE